jgi:tyrosyl-DNA phosphodiesterase 2
MLQEVGRESLQVIMENSWVQRNFVLSNVDPPESIYTDIRGDSFILRELNWAAPPYFTLMMTSRHLAVTSCFRVPFIGEMGRDALVVDIPVFSPGRRTQPKEFFRLCTTHLESLEKGRAYRLGQLALISALLRGPPTTESSIIAGIVGGDMNAIDKSEHLFHKAINVDLKDVWEDVPAPPIPILKPFQKDLSYGQARGNTWGYQSNGKRERKRMDKFLYTGSIETVAIHGIQDTIGRLGRLGIGLKTEVEAWEYEYERLTRLSRRRGKYVEEPLKEYYSETSVARLRDKGLLKEGKLVRTKLNRWVSDHFGIAVGIKVL